MEDDFFKTFMYANMMGGMGGQNPNNPFGTGPDGQPLRPMTPIGLINQYKKDVINPRRKAAWNKHNGVTPEPESAQDTQDNSDPTWDTSQEQPKSRFNDDAGEFVEYEDVTETQAPPFTPPQPDAPKVEVPTDYVYNIRDDMPQTYNLLPKGSGIKEVGKIRYFAGMETEDGTVVKYEPSFRYRKLSELEKLATNEDNPYAKHGQDFIDLFTLTDTLLVSAAYMVGGDIAKKLGIDTTNKPEPISGELADSLYDSISRIMYDIETSTGLNAGTIPGDMPEPYSDIYSMIKQLQTEFDNEHNN